MNYEQAVRFLQAHYAEDDLRTCDIYGDIDHWSWVNSDVTRFPNADREYLTQWLEAADVYTALS